MVGEHTDLEDRWFDRRWLAFGATSDPNVLPQKPVECRTLWSPLSSAPQGQLDLWLDILTHAEAKAHPLVDIAPPPPEEYEIRLIVWQTKEVQFKKRVLKKSDLYVRAWIEGSPAQKTDKHYRCTEGVASFNWRMKFPVQLPLKYPLLHVQV